MAKYKSIAVFESDRTIIQKLSDKEGKSMAEVVKEKLSAKNPPENSKKELEERDTALAEKQSQLQALTEEKTKLENDLSNSIFFSGDVTKKFRELAKTNNLNEDQMLSKLMEAAKEENFMMLIRQQDTKELLIDAAKKMMDAGIEKSALTDDNYLQILLKKYIA